VEISDELKMKSTVAILVNTWRARLLVLQQAEWELIREPEKLRNLGNCPPVGIVESRGGTFSCRQYRICPFCWCRKYVLELFARIYAIRARCDKKRLPFDLIEMRTERLYPMQDYFLEAPFDWIKHCKASYYREQLPDAFGGFVLCTVEPPDYSKKERHYRLYQRMLALVPKRVPTPSVELSPMDSSEPQQESRQVQRASNPSVIAIAAAVGRVCIYPSQLMRGSATDTVKILNAQAMIWKKDRTGQARKQFPVRMSEFYGILRRRRSTDLATTDL